MSTHCNLKLNENTEKYKKNLEVRTNWMLKIKSTWENINNIYLLTRRLYKVGKPKRISILICYRLR